MLPETENFYKEVYDQDFNSSGPHGWIQWKGTNVCIDLHCSCGSHEHYDGDFFYFYECSKCGAKYAVGQVVKLIELNGQQIGYAEKTTVGFTKLEPEIDFTKFLGDS